MKKVGKFFSSIILIINLLVGGLLIFSAYSPYIDPTKYPVLACAGLTFPVFLIVNICFLIFWLLIYRRFFWIPLVFLLICIAQIRTYFPLNFRTKDIPENAIKILSYNTMALNNRKAHTKENPNLVLQYIQNSQADIICIQEFILGIDKKHIQKKEIDKALSAYPYQSVVPIGREENKLACYSKYPILSAKKIDGESRYNGSAIFELLIDSDTVTIISNHLESNKLTLEDRAAYVDMIKSPQKETVTNGARLLIGKLAEANKIRGKQVQVLSDIIQTYADKTLIVCGDFNDSPISYTHRMLSRGLDDTFVKSGRGAGISYNRNGFYFRIDNILISKNLKAYNCTVDRSIKESDHYPIWCYLTKQKE